MDLKTDRAAMIQIEENYFQLLEQVRLYKPRKETKEIRVRMANLLERITNYQFDDVERVGQKATIHLQLVERLIDILTRIHRTLTILVSEHDSIFEEMAAKQFSKYGSEFFDIFTGVTSDIEFVSEYLITCKGLIADWKKSKTNADLQLKSLDKLLKKTSKLFKSLC